MNSCFFYCFQIFDYEVDSADEWEEEEPGESLHGSDDEKDKESEDEYEVDNSIFVPHGYLSDDEGDEEENEEVFVRLCYYLTRKSATCNHYHQKIELSRVAILSFTCFLFSES